MRRVDLWWETVYGPAKIEQASPWNPWQLAAKMECSAEYCLPRIVPWPTKQWVITEDSLTELPLVVMKCRAMTPGPTYAGSSGELFMVPSSSR